VLQCVAVCCSCSVLRYVVVCCSVLRQQLTELSQKARVSLACVAVSLACVAVCCSILQSAVVCCSVLQYVAVCCSVLQSVVACCSAVHPASTKARESIHVRGTLCEREGVLQSKLHCECNELLCVAVRCIVQCVAVCCSVV